MSLVATVPPSIVLEQPLISGAANGSAGHRLILRVAVNSPSEMTAADTREDARRTIAELEPAWSLVIRHSVFRLRTLEAGWDGNGSAPISTKVLFRAETLVRDALAALPKASAPYFVPVADGGVQIEWHERSGELELSISPEGETYLWGRSHVSDHEFEGESGKALALFLRWAPRFASENGDAPNALVVQDGYVSIAA